MDKISKVLERLSQNQYSQDFVRTKTEHTQLTVFQRAQNQSKVSKPVLRFPAVASFHNANHGIAHIGPDTVMKDQFHLITLISRSDRYATDVGKLYLTK